MGIYTRFSLLGAAALLAAAPQASSAAALCDKSEIRFVNSMREIAQPYPGAASGVPHAAGSFTFAAKVVSQPDHSVTIEAVDRAAQAPVKGIHVLLHPYRAITDENGVAKLQVAKGSYKLHISGFKYVPYQATIDAAEDVTLRAELRVEPPPAPFYPQPIEE